MEGCRGRGKWRDVEGGEVEGCRGRGKWRDVEGGEGWGRCRGRGKSGGM